MLKEIICSLSFSAKFSLLRKNQIIGKLLSLTSVNVIEGMKILALLLLSGSKITIIGRLINSFEKSITTIKERKPHNAFNKFP